MIRMNRKMLSVALVVFALASALPAAVITQTFTTGAINPGSPTISSFSVNRFNEAALGTLTSVTITMTIETWGGYFTVINATSDNSPVSGSFSIGVSAWLSGSRVPDGSPLSSPPTVANESDTFYLAGTGDEATISGPASNNRNTSGPISDNASSEDFALYQGTGTYTISFYSSTAYVQSASGAITGEFGPMSSQGYLTVSYEYEPIPEPTSLGLVLLGVGAMAVRRRIRRKD